MEHLEHLLQRSRYELKYLVDEARAAAVRDFARTYLAPDPHAVGRDPSGWPIYPIYSVYVDSPKMDLFRATVDGHKNRFKLRARYYDANPNSPVFFEIKRRVNGAILKDRAKVRRSEAPRLLDGAPPECDMLVNPADPHAYAALIRFCDLRDRLGAQPRVIVSYDREAWLTPDNNSARLTIDRNVAGGPFDPFLPASPGPGWVFPDVGGSILELKFTDRFPAWMREMVQVFNLQRCSLAKYIKVVHGMEPGRKLYPRTRERKPVFREVNWSEAGDGRRRAVEPLAPAAEAPAPVERAMPAERVPAASVPTEPAPAVRQARVAY